jgi:cytochrome c biogenesis factor
MEQTPGRISAGAIIEMYKDGKLIKTKRPRINSFPGQSMNVPTPAVIYLPWHDVYLNIVGVLSPEQEFVTLRAIQSPLVTWIWIGGAIMALGTVYALSPNSRKIRESREIREGAKG